MKGLGVKREEPIKAMLREAEQRLEVIRAAF